MMRPRICVVVALPEGAERVGDTLESLLGQDYEPLEVVVHDAGSDHTARALVEDIARRHPGIVKPCVEPADVDGKALERSFANASGDVFGYLCAGQVLLPGALQSVAVEISRPGRHVVLGRACVVVEGAEGPAVEHPSEYLGRFDHLAAWKRPFDPIPPGALFWDRDAGARAGPFPRLHPAVVAYDLACRLGERDTVHPVDRLWSASRLPAARPDGGLAEWRQREMRIETSRRHWGSWLSPLRWRCEASWALHRLHRHDRARHWARYAEDAVAAGRPAAAAMAMLRTWLHSPAMARQRFRHWRASRARQL